MSLELIAAGKLLDMALGGIVGDASSEGAKLLWQTLKNRLLRKHDVIEAEIIELEQNPTPEKLKPLEPFLQLEMRTDQVFAEAISRLGEEIAQASKSENITTGDISAETGGVAAAQINAPNSKFGGSDTIINLGKDIAQKK